MKKLIIALRSKPWYAVYCRILCTASLAFSISSMPKVVHKAVYVFWTIILSVSVMVKVRIQDITYESKFSLDFSNVDVCVVLFSKLYLDKL